MQADSREWRVCMEICQCSSVSSLQDGGRSSRGHTLCDMQASLVCSAFVCCSDVGGKQRPSLYVCQSISENQHGWIMRHITSLPTTSIFFLSLSKKKEIKQDSTNTRKKVWQWQHFSFFFFIEINRWHCTHLNYKWLIVSMWPRIRSLDWMGVNPISVRLPNPVMNSGL